MPMRKLPRPRSLSYHKSLFPKAARLRLAPKRPRRADNPSHQRRRRHCGRNSRFHRLIPHLDVGQFVAPPRRPYRCHENLCTESGELRTPNHPNGVRRGSVPERLNVTLRYRWIPVLGLTRRDCRYSRLWPFRIRLRITMVHEMPDGPLMARNSTLFLRIGFAI